MKIWIQAKVVVYRAEQVIWIRSVVRSFRIRLVILWFSFETEAADHVRSIILQ